MSHERAGRKTQKLNARPAPRPAAGCSPGRFAAETYCSGCPGATAPEVCGACPTGRSTHLGGTECFECQKGRFNREVAQLCFPCPEDTDSEPGRDDECIACERKGICLGDGTCRAGYEGIWCGHCASRYFSYRNTCFKCPDTRGTLVLSMVLFICFCMVMLRLGKVSSNSDMGGLVAPTALGKMQPQNFLH